MLTVYSTQGSPGASTTAMHLAANWASEGREVLLIEADPAGGSLSHNLGIQFTPGSASFVGSGLPILSNHLIDHAQDVLFENLHVMPAPASPTGARGIFNTFAEFSEDLRAISEHEMAVIIDGGRMTADTAASALTTGATGVVVVCRNNSQLPSLEHLRDALAASPGGDGPQACAVTVGKSPMGPEEWQDNYGLTFSGSIEIVADMATDLSAYLARSKRKSKKWRASLEQVGEKLYPYAQPPVSNRLRRPAAAAPPDTEVSDDASQATPAAAPPDTEVSDDASQATPAAAPPDTEVSDDASQATPAAAPPDTEVSDDASQATPAAAPPDTEVSGDASQATPAAATFDPAAHDPAGYGQAPPEGFPAYGQAPPEGFPAYGQAPPMAPAPQPGHGQSHYLPPTPESPPGQGQSHYLPPTGWPADPQNPSRPGYGEAPPEGFPAYGQPTQPLYPPAQYPSQPYEQPPQYPSQPYEQPPQYPSQPYEQPPQYPSQPYEQPPQYPSQPYEQPPQYPSQPYEQPPQYPSQPYEQPPQYPSQPYEQPPQYPSQPGTYEQPPLGAHEQPPNYEAHEPPQYPSHSYEQPAAQPEPPAQEAAHPQPPETESPPRPNMKPTGSFRDWAVKLHGSNAEDMTAHRGG